MISPCPQLLNWTGWWLIYFKKKETVDKIFSVTLICTNMVAHTLYRHLKYSLQKWITEFLIKIWPYYIFSNLLYCWNVLTILQWLNFDWINKSRFSLNLERWKLQVKPKGKILQVNQFTSIGNTMDLFWLMHEVQSVEMVNILRFLFLFLFFVFLFTAKLNEFA